MRALRDGAEARDLIAAHFQPGVRTNHFLAPAELDGEIARGRLWASEWAGGVAFYHQKTGYWRLTFYLNDPEAPFGGELPPVWWPPRSPTGRGRSLPMSQQLSWIPPWGCR